MMERECFTCSNLIGCPLLADKKGVFNADRIVRTGDTCNDWSPIDQQQKDVRDVLYGIQGEGCLRILHQVPSMIMDRDQLTKEEGADEMISGEMPDLAGMLREGMTTTEREEQLRFETDERGDLYVEPSSGDWRPRPSYQLRKFACDVDGHIQLDHSVGMFWTLDRVIKHILAVEVEQGFIEKPKKSKNKSAKEAATTETNMAKEGRQVLVKRGGKPAVKAPGPKPTAGPKPAGTKVASPPARRGAKPAQAQTATNQPDADDGGNETPAAAPFDVQTLLEDIQVAVGETVARAVEEAKTEILNQVVETHNLNIEALTLLQDRLAATGGTMQWQGEDEEIYGAPALVGTERGILEHIDGLDAPLPE